MSFLNYLNQIINLIPQQLQLGLLVILATIMAVIALLIVYKILLLRLRPDGLLTMLVAKSCWPIILLIAYLGLKRGLDELWQAEVLKNAATFSLFDSIPVAIALGWIVIKCVNAIEVAGTAKESTTSTIKLPKFIYRSTLRERQIIFRSFRVASWVLIGMFMLKAFGVDLATLLAFGGAGGIVIGLAAKEILGDSMSGLVIEWADELEIGDWIKVRNTDIEGVVEKFTPRTTLIRTFDKRPLYVPNTILTSNVIENAQRMTHRRIYEYMGLRYSDIDKMEPVLQDVKAMLKEHPGIDSQNTLLVAFDRYGESSLDFYIYCLTSTTDWIESVQIKESILLKIAKIVKEHDADFAFPTRTLVMENPQSSIPPSKL